MFYPGASAVACCMIFDLSQKHEKSDKDTFFGYYKDDQFVKRKGLGRIERTDSNGNSLWLEIEKQWLDLYKTNRTVPGLSVMRRVTWQDEWLAEAYMETDYSLLNENDFRRTINNFLAFLVKESDAYGYELDWEWVQDYIKSLRYNTFDITSSKTEIVDFNVNEWKKFKIGKLFEIQLSKGDIKIDDMEIGNIPLISSGESNNGIVGFIDAYGDGKAEIFNGNKLTVDMFGNAFYQPNDFYAVSHGRVNILMPHFDLTKNIGLFISAIIKKEQYKYSYGRAVYSGVAADMDIVLPIQRSEDNTPLIDKEHKYSDEGYIPDWQWMENYIKSLPYGERL
jgi:hypothetical protein